MTTTNYLSLTRLQLLEALRPYVPTRRYPELTGYSTAHLRAMLVWYESPARDRRVPNGARTTLALG